METYPQLEKFRKDISRCALCAGCHFQCPTYSATLDESMSARGKLGLIEGLLKGDLGISDKFAEKMFQCLSCFNCSDICPSGVDPVRIINAARAEVLARKKNDALSAFIFRYILPSGWRTRFFARLAGFGLKIFSQWIPARKVCGLDLSFMRNGKRRKVPEISGAFLKKKYPELIKVENPVMRVLFFTGCLGDWVYQKACSQLIDFLGRNRIEVLLPKDLLCCGAPLYYSGEKDIATEVARQNMMIIQKHAPDYVITNCATCGLTLKDVYGFLLPKEEVASLAGKVMDIHLFIKQKIDFKPAFCEKRKIRVTYHDPCHLGRGQGVISEPRELLKSIPWVEYVEMEGADICCGGGGTFSLKYYDMALEIASQKVDAIKKTGAEVVATGCPSCQVHISDALSRNGLNIPVVHTSQLLLKESA